MNYKILFVTVSLNTKYLKSCKEKVKHYFPESTHVIINGLSNWPYPAFEWTNLIKEYDCDYLILIDEDCFLTSNLLSETLDYMMNNNISLCGPSEGFSKYRSANHHAMNTFFMIINKKDYLSLDINLSGIQFGMNENGWINSLYPNYNNESIDFDHDKSIGGSNLVYEQEPYYFLFWLMIQKGLKFHYLYQHFDEELKSTNLRLFKDSSDICLHMWYLRQYEQDMDVWGISNRERYLLLDKYLNKDKKQTIGLLIIATNKYVQFLPNLIESADKYFLVDKDVEYFIFTNKELDIKSNRKISYVSIEHKEWPWMTLGRYKIFTLNQDLLSNKDYLFYTDSDMLFCDLIGDEILSDRVATTHPGYLGGRGTPETNNFSLACVKTYEDMQYFAGGFNGGTSYEYLKMSKTLSNNIDIDYSNGIIAIWHDESHMNRYFIDNQPTKILDPGYCYGESMNIPFKKRLLALDKNHEKIRN